MAKKSKKSPKSRIDKFLKGKFKGKDIIKSSNVVVEIKQYKQEPYKPIYMKEEIEEDKRQFFFHS